MDVSKRIDFIVDNLDKVECLADIGTDHGYVPLLALEREKANKVIACDINKDPLDKAKLNAILEGIVGNEIDFRLGSGLKPLEMKEANSVVIAGMGGNLIRDILEADIEKVNSLESLICKSTSLITYLLFSVFLCGLYVKATFEKLIPIMLPPLYLLILDANHYYS